MLHGEVVAMIKVAMVEMTFADSRTTPAANAACHMRTTPATAHMATTPAATHMTAADARTLEACPKSTYRPLCQVIRNSRTLLALSIFTPLDELRYRGE